LTPRVLLLLAIAFAAAAPVALRAQPHAREAAAAPTVTHGVAVGEVTPTSALVWARADRPAEMTVRLWTSGGEPHEAISRVGADTDFAGTLRFVELLPDTEYHYRVWFTEAGKRPWRRHAVDGRFRTPPDSQAARAVVLAWGGDLGGQNVCRDAAQGFPIFEPLVARKPDLFVGLGDMIYGDDLCEAQGLYGNAQVPGGFGKASDVSGYWEHWRYARADSRLRRLLAATVYVPLWDDHEVVNDFGPQEDVRDTPPYTAGEHLLPSGLHAFLDWNPVTRPEAGPPRLYGSHRWGRHLELFVLDARGHRDANRAPDSADRPKTLLGAEQRRWLQRALAASNATWKVVASSVPLSIPTGGVVRDGWANEGTDAGFERELVGILRSLAESGVRGLVWITTDVHFATGFRYVPFEDAPGFELREYVTGPLHAGLFPSTALDPTLRPERLFFFGPDSPGAPKTFEEARRWFNFGVLDVDAAGRLSVEVVNTAGEPVYREALEPAASPAPQR
jgi:alkaline phosphatase D